MLGSRTVTPAEAIPMKLKCQSIRHSYIVQPLLFSVIKVTEKRREIVSRGNGLLQKTNILCRGQRSGMGVGKFVGTCTSVCRVGVVCTAGSTPSLSDDILPE